MPKRGRNAILKRFGGRLGRWSVAGLRSCTMRGPRPLVLKRSSSSWPLWPRLRRSRHAPRGRWRTISAGITEKEAGLRVGTSSGNSQTPSFGLRMHKLMAGTTTAKAAILEIFLGSRIGPFQTRSLVDEPARRLPPDKTRRKPELHYGDPGPHPQARCLAWQEALSELLLSMPLLRVA